MTLEDFYADLSTSSPPGYEDVGRGMLLLINMINRMFTETKIWGLTSLARLVLRNKDDFASEWYIIIGNAGNTFYIEYLLPEDKRPWHNAYVRGEAGSLEEAGKYLLIAMKECEGWVGNVELEQLTSAL